MMRWTVVEDGAESGRIMFVSKYVPGPQAGSVSGQYHETARHDSSESSRDAGAIPADWPPVLSMTACSGKPVEEAEAEGVKDAEAEGVIVDVNEAEGVTVDDRLVARSQVCLIALAVRPR